MDFYERKQIGADLIDKLVSAGSLHRKDIIFALFKETQLGERFVNKYLDEMISRNFFVENANGIISKQKDDKKTLNNA